MYCTTETLNRASDTTSLTQMITDGAMKDAGVPGCLHSIKREQTFLKARQERALQNECKPTHVSAAGLKEAEIPPAACIF